MKSIQLVFGAALLLLAPAARADNVTYTFSTLAAGPLTHSPTVGDAGNQDGWYGDSASPKATFVIGPDSAFHNANVAEPSGISQGALAFRASANSFFSPGTTGADIEVDFCLGFNASNFQFSLTGDGTRAGLNNDIGQTKFSPSLAVVAVGTTGMTIRMAPLNAKGYAKEVTQDVASYAGHAYAIKLSINFTANGGDGSGTLFYKDLTQGGTWIQTTIKDVNLGLTNSAIGSTFSRWNQVHIIETSANTLPYTTIAGFSITGSTSGARTNL